MYMMCLCVITHHVNTSKLQKAYKRSQCIITTTILVKYCELNTLYVHYLSSAITIANSQGMANNGHFWFYIKVKL